MFRDVGLFLPIGTPRVLLATTGVPSWLMLVADLVTGQIVTIILIYATVQSLRGHKAGILECFGQGFSRLPAAIGGAVLSVIACVLGLGLLIVPGLILASLWAAAISVAVVPLPARRASRAGSSRRHRSARRHAARRRRKAPVPRAAQARAITRAVPSRAGRVTCRDARVPRDLAARSSPTHQPKTGRKRSWACR